MDHIPIPKEFTDASEEFKTHLRTVAKYSIASHHANRAGEDPVRWDTLVAFYWDQWVNPDQFCKKVNHVFGFGCSECRNGTHTTYRCICCGERGHGAFETTTTHDCREYNLEEKLDVFKCPVQEMIYSYLAEKKISQSAYFKIVDSLIEYANIN